MNQRRVHALRRANTGMDMTEQIARIGLIGKGHGNYVSPHIFRQKISAAARVEDYNNSPGQ